MGAIVTSKFRTQNLMVFIDQFKTTGSVDDNFLYLGFGRSDAWPDDAQGNDESARTARPTDAQIRQPA